MQEASEKQKFWKTAEEPHEKNELCIILWRSKNGSDFDVDLSWWSDGEWYSYAKFNPPDFWAPIPNPEQASGEENKMQEAPKLKPGIYEKIESILSKGDRVELIPVKDGVKVVRVRREEIK